MIQTDQLDINELNLTEMDVYWDKAKLQLKSHNQ
jgi:hypothetical protein